MTLQQEAWLTRDGVRAQLLCEGSIRIGWVDAAQMRPGRIPAAIVDVLTPT